MLPPSKIQWFWTLITVTDIPMQKRNKMGKRKTGREGRRMKSTTSKITKSIKANSIRCLGLGIFICSLWFQLLNPRLYSKSFLLFFWKAEHVFSCVILLGFYFSCKILGIQQAFSISSICVPFNSSWEYFCWYYQKPRGSPMHVTGFMPLDAGSSVDLFWIITCLFLASAEMVKEIYESHT